MGVSAPVAESLSPFARGVPGGDAWAHRVVARPVKFARCVPPGAGVGVRVSLPRKPLRTRREAGGVAIRRVPMTAARGGWRGLAAPKIRPRAVAPGAPDKPVDART